MDRWLPLAGCLLLAGCMLGRSERATLPVSTTLVRNPLVIQADFDLEADHPLLGELTQLRERIAQTLVLQLSPQPIEVHLFATSERFHATLAERFPDFPVRRAFFVKTPGRYEVYAQWNEHTPEDLRHETTHAYLHTTLPDLPLWLDEGLAEYFETPPATAGWHASHADLLMREFQRGHWRPDLRRLENLASSGDMTQLDYAESWAWTYLLLNTTPARRDLLVHQLHARQRGEVVGPVSEPLHRFEAAPQETLVHMLFSVTQK